MKYNSPGWFKNCFKANPLGTYAQDLSGIGWYTFDQNMVTSSLDSIVFKIRPNECMQGYGLYC